MLRAIKIICGVGCYTAALFPGGLALDFFLDFGGTETFPLFCIAVILSALAASLFWSGSYLIARLDSPLARKAKVLIPLCVFCWLGILVAIIAPSFGKARPTSSANACINNLRQLDAAANQFALEHSLTNGDRINFPNDLTPYIKLNNEGKIPPCPVGGIYHVGRVGNPPVCTLGTTVTPAHVLP